MRIIRVSGQMYAWELITSNVHTGIWGEAAMDRISEAFSQAQ
jgi:hypothetical protein